MGLEFDELQELSGQPLEHIPDAWAHKGACPVCRASKSLIVTHLEEEPDRFVCENCAAAFEIQTSGGGQIRARVIPEVLQPVWNEVFNRWLDPSELQALYQRYHAEVQTASPEEDESVAEPTLSNMDVMKRVVELKRLGNEDKTVELLLHQAGATPPQIKGAIKKYQEISEQQSKTRGRAVWSMIVAAVLILALIAGIAWMVAQLGIINLVPQEDLEKDQMITDLLEGQSYADISAAAAPEVFRGGPQAAPCPTSPAKASALFSPGFGSSSDWQFFTEYNAWLMINRESPVTVRIPSNTYAGVVNLDTMEVDSFSGSALIRNANVVVILCESK